MRVHERAILLNKPKVLHALLHLKTPHEEHSGDFFKKASAEAAVTGSLGRTFLAICKSSQQMSNNVFALLQ